MKKKSKYPYRSVEVIWRDAASNAEAWVEPAHLAKPAEINTRGWLVKEASDHIVVASSIDEDGDPDSSVGAVITIPKGWEISIKELKVVEHTRKSKKETKVRAVSNRRQASLPAGMDTAASGTTEEVGTKLLS